MEKSKFGYYVKVSENIKVYVEDIAIRYMSRHNGFGISKLAL